MKEKDYFLDACFSDNLQEWYSNYIKEKPSRLQNFTVIEEMKDDEIITTYTHKYWMPSSFCRSTKEKLNRDDAVVTHGYWTPFCWFPIHKNLKREHELNEAYECQKIDQSCNDCAFFDRANSHCKKLNKPTQANPNICADNPCFVHRKDVTYK